MIIRAYILSIVLLITTTSCKESKEEELRVAYTNEDHISLVREVKILMQKKEEFIPAFKVLEDSLFSWFDRKKAYHAIHCPDSVKLDSCIIFNSNQDLAISFWTYVDPKDSAVHDAIRYVILEKFNSVWVLHDLKTVTSHWREGNNFKPFSRRQLIESAYSDLLSYEWIDVTQKKGNDEEILRSYNGALESLIELRKESTDGNTPMVFEEQRTVTLEYIDSLKPCNDQ